MDSKTSKWVYFFVNATEDVWLYVQLKECLEADYRWQLHFQLTQDGLAVATGAEETKVIDNFCILVFSFME